MKIKKGDTIKIMVGKDKGKSGKIIEVFPSKGRIVIEGLNLYKKNVRPKHTGEKGQTIMVSRPVNASNVMLVCPSCGKTTRIGHRVEGKNKLRICKKCSAVLH